MYCHNRKSICVLVLLLAWSQQIRSQDDVTPAQPSDTVVNGHTASSVGTREEQIKLDGVTGFVNGPTGAPVQVPVGQLGLPGDTGFYESPPGTTLVAGGTSPGATGFINAPTGISVEAEEHRPDAIKGLVNGPTGISVEAEEEQRSDGVTAIVDDPTGIPEEVEQRSDGFTDYGDGSTSDLAEAAENQGPQGVAGLVDGPAGTSIGEEEQESDGATGLVSGPTVIPEEGEELKSGGVMGFVNGPTGISVEAEEEQMSDGVSGDADGPTGSSLGTEQELARPSNRGVLSTAPEEGQHMKQQLPAGLHIDTADWSKDSAHYSFKGGEWSLVDLPDPAHPAIPAPVVPGPALVVVTDKYLKKVYVQREMAGLANVTLHYRFFLTEGEAPHGVPELKVYQRVGSSPQLLATETTRGAWSDRTVHLSESGPFTIIFEGRLNKEGNEIAIDDVTISGISDGGGDGLGERGATIRVSDAPPDAHHHDAPPPDAHHHDAPPPPPSDLTDINAEGPTVVSTASEVPQHGNETLDILEETQEGETTEDTQVPVVNQGMVSEATETPDAAGELPKKTEATSGNNLTEISSDVGLSTPSRGMEEAEGGADSRDNMTATPVLIPTPPDSITVDDESVSRENDTAALNSMPESTVLSEENGTAVSPYTSDSVQLGGKNETADDELVNEENETDFPTPDSEMVNGENETVLSSTTNGELVSEGNNTEGLLETTFATDGTREPEINTSIATDPQPSTDNSSHPIPEETSPISLTTPAGTVEEVSREDFTESPTLLQTPEVSQSTSTTGEGYSVPANNSGGLQDTTGTPGVSQPPVSTTLDTSDTSPKTTVVTFSSASPSGSINTTAPGTSETLPVARTPWGVFQIFLVLCVLGFVVLGFLYWRKKRRQDDEIPVFTRSSHADYLNPTFSPDDDSSFASYGGRHNYKSFE